MDITDDKKILWAINEINNISFDLMHQISSGPLGEQMQKIDNNFSAKLYCLAVSMASMSSTRYALDQDKPDVEDIMNFFNVRINESGLPIAASLQKVE